MVCLFFVLSTGSLSFKLATLPTIRPAVAETGPPSVHPILCPLENCPGSKFSNRDVRHALPIPAKTKVVWPVLVFPLAG